MASQMDRTRILYTNLKNNRGSAQFLAQINPTKVVNIVPIPHKSGAGGGAVQGIVNKTIQRVVVSSSQSQSQQLASAFRQSANANASSTQSTNAILGTNAGNTLIITTSTASDGSSIIFNDINTTSTITNSINTNNSSQAINLGNLTVTASEKLNHNDVNTTSINR